MEQVELVMQCRKIISVNNYLAARVKIVNKKPVPYLSLTNEASEFKKSLKSSLVSNYSQEFQNNLENIKSFLESSSKFRTDVFFYIRENRIMDTDLTNLKKMVEDTVGNFISDFKIKYDDCQVMKSEEEKCPIDSDSEIEEIKFIIKLY